VDIKILQLRTGTRTVTDVTSQLHEFAAAVGGDGLLHAFLPHATCGLALMETGAGSEQDLQAVLADLLPRDDRWRHRHGSPGHGGDHVLPAFISPSVTVPVDGGVLALGTWQSVVIVDPNVDNPVRTLRLSMLTAATT
jgi:secondary thiamine-phosphate synthase enzyme